MSWFKLNDTSVGEVKQIKTEKEITDENTEILGVKKDAPEKIYRLTFHELEDAKIFVLEPFSFYEDVKLYDWYQITDIFEYLQNYVFVELTKEQFKKAMEYYCLKKMLDTREKFFTGDD
jgi:hypothetical protein